jgi:hypothetical protein
MKEVNFRKPFERLTPINKCQLVEVIEVTSIVGEGDVEGTPCREVVEYYSKDGILLARYDHYLQGELEKGVWS